MALLSVHNLSVAIGSVSPLDGIGFTLEKGEVLGLVGESGSGKSLTATTVMGLLPRLGGRVTQGAIHFDGHDLTQLPERAYRRLRGRRIALISQNPMTSLDPILPIGPQVEQPARLHLGLSESAARDRAIGLMEQLRIPEAATVYRQYPHQLSGGMKQRIVIAMALMADPDLIIADEPTTALDVTIQAQIVQILADLVADRGLALLLITHDMGVVAQICDRVTVLYAGRVAESAPVRAIFAAPQHPYTRALIGCIPQENQPRGSLRGIPGTVPGVKDYPSGCRFHPRCAIAGPICQTEVPPRLLSERAEIACWKPGEMPHV
ncbi:ABC transporter [Elstera litoralis]|uniref:ABC transporter n=1 Tax=Elstera litoralis TaxID=552518 RepID=A0A0F3IPW8_9PROT|nr:ABC transporter ATP-binding protein [Elstera litoralis]KJV08578.1 ABC transporter [Elstera litoralis]